MTIKKVSLLAILVACMAKQHLSAQPIEGSTKSLNTLKARTVTAHAVVAVTSVPYCLDVLWQVPSGGRVGWITASVANPDPLRTNARVFLLRGSGTVFSPGFGEICSRLRGAGILTEDLGPAGDGWACRHLIHEHGAGRLPGPIVLVGHSRGARHALEAARELEKAGICVDLLVCLDVTLPPLVPGNVRQALNVYMSRDRLYPADSLQPSRGSMAHIENVDLSNSEVPKTTRGLHHLNFPASPIVQNLVVGQIFQVMRESSPPMLLGQLVVPITDHE